MDLSSFPAFFYLLTLWTLLWKGLALWRAAQLRQRNWFIAMLILNSMGILEIIYLFRFAKKQLTLAEVKTWKLSGESKK